MKEWILDNWDQLLGAVGVGAGSGFLGKKFIDAKQDSKIKSLDKRVSAVESDLKINTTLDKDFKSTINNRFDTLEKQGSMILSHLLNNKIK